MTTAIEQFINDHTRKCPICSEELVSYQDDHLPEDCICYLKALNAELAEAAQELVDAGRASQRGGIMGRSAAGHPLNRLGVARQRMDTLLAGAGEP